MVVPCLRSHLYRNQYTSYRSYYGGYHLIDFQPLYKIYYCRNTDTAPYSVSIERTCISIVSFTRLHRCLVKINDDCESCHKEQEKHNPELTYSTLSAICLPEQSYQAEQ